MNTFLTKFAMLSGSGFDSPSQTWLNAPASIIGWNKPSFFTLSMGFMDAEAFRYVEFV